VLVGFWLNSNWFTW